MVFLFRNIKEDDYYKDYFELLSQLTNANKIDYNSFLSIFNEIKNNVFVIEDLDKNKIVASGTLFIEKKFIHSGGLVGHMEDIVVDKNYRNNKLGIEMVENLIKRARQQGCYKIIGNCKKELIQFYQKNGFEKKGEQIGIYF